MLKAKPNSRDTTNRITKITIRILAISIENPATPRAPKIYAMNAIMRNRMPRPSNVAMIKNFGQSLDASRMIFM